MPPLPNELAWRWRLVAPGKVIRISAIWLWQLLVAGLRCCIATPNHPQCLRLESMAEKGAANLEITLPPSQLLHFTARSPLQ